MIDNYSKEKVDLLVKEAEAKIRKNKEDGVFRPEHYVQWAMEPFTYFILNQIPFAEASVIKYIMRWKKKDGLKDLRKARRIIDMMIEFEENKGKYTPERGCL
jgi:hypothetical protein